MKLDRRKNCFNVIRLLAALQVFCEHTSIHLKIELPQAIKFVLAFFPGVPVFFILSGFLLWDSLNRSDDFKQYIRKRAFRLFPELWGGDTIKCNYHVYYIRFIH